MRRVRWVAGLLVCAAFAVPAPAGQGTAPRFTVEEMLQLKRVSDPQLSPSGARVAFVITELGLEQNTRASHIWTVPASGGEPVAIARSDRSEDTPRWSPDGTRLAFVSTRDKTSQIWIVSVSAAGAAIGEPRKVTSLLTEAAGVRWSPDGKLLAFVSDVFPECDSLACNDAALEQFEARQSKAHVFDRLLFRHWTSWKDGRVSHVFVVPADGSAPPRDLTPGSADTPPFSLGGPDDYAFSPDGREIAFVQKTDAVEAISTNSDVFVLDLSTAGAKPRRITVNPGADGGPAYSPDGRFIAYRAQERAGFEADRWQLMLFDRKAGTRRSATPSWDRSADAYAWAPDAAAIYLTAENQGRSDIFRLRLSGGEPVPMLMMGTNADLQISRDGRMIVFSQTTLASPAEIMAAPLDGADGQVLKGVTRVTRANPGLGAFKLRPGESVTYAGAGGTKIQAWIVRPPDFTEGKKYPLLYLVHGGPQNSWHDGWTFRWNAQVFASAGYVVFMPNPTGSTGFGQRFTDDISGDWGGRPFEDLMRGADYAEALPYVDRERTVAAGASYGGYMMNWFLGHTDRFKAIVSHAGVFNLTSMYGATEELWFPEWDLKGTPWTNPESYDKWSPHRFAKNFKTPTLVTHGELDFRVPIGEGLQLFTTLQRLGVPSKMIYFPDEGHWINRPANSVLWYRTFIEWMDRWIK
jgi:dipeptidyl aminopeptidase/acylaminoacyl peptidase